MRHNSGSTGNSSQSGPIEITTNQKKREIPHEPASYRSSNHSKCNHPVPERDSVVIPPIQRIRSGPFVHPSLLGQKRPGCWRQCLRPNHHTGRSIHKQRRLRRHESLSSKSRCITRPSKLPYQLIQPPQRGSPHHSRHRIKITAIE